MPYDREVERAVSVRLSVELHEAILARAALDDRTMAAVIRRALRLYLETADG
jgi:predicted DNA-binding protein